MRVLWSLMVLLAAVSEQPLLPVAPTSAAVADGSVVEFGARDVDLAHLRSGDGPRSEGGTFRCTYEPVAPGWDPDYHLVDTSGIPWAARFYWVVCDERRRLRWYVPAWHEDPVRHGLVTELVQEAFDRIAAPRPVVLLSPAAGRVQLTGLPTWLAIAADGYARVEGSVTAGAVRVDAWLQPVRTAWLPGDGSSVACDGPGSVYDPQRPHHLQTPSCRHTYVVGADPRTGDTDTAYELTSRVVYQAGYRVHGLPGLTLVYSLGELEGPATTAVVEVRGWRGVRLLR